MDRHRIGQMWIDEGLHEDQAQQEQTGKAVMAQGRHG
jgi:hypothetical protein